MRRSRAGRPVRRMITCFPASTIWACPVESRSSHGLTPVPFGPFLRWPGRAGRAAGSGSSSGWDWGVLGSCGGVLI